MASTEIQGEDILQRRGSRWSMDSGLWLGIDVGTTGVRSIIYDDDLRPVSTGYLECSPRYLPGGVVEQDPEDWWRAVLQVTAAALDGVDRRKVRGLSVSSQGISIVVVDRTGAPVRPAIIWLDSRGEVMLPGLADRMDPADVERRTGKPFRGDYTLACLAWLSEYEPDSLAPGSLALMPMDFVILKLTGRAVTDRTMASGSMYYDIGQGDWDSELLSAAGVTRALLPPVVQAGSLAGPLLPEIARTLGLPSDVVVAVGGQDQKCAAYGAGLDKDTFTLSLGTSAALSAVEATPARPVSGAAVFAHLFEGQWIREAAVSTAGAANRWFAQVLKADDFDTLSAESEAGYPSPGGPFFLPHLSSAVRGQWPVKPAGVFWGLGLDTSRSEMVRAVMEGVAFEIGLARLALAAGVGSQAERIRLFGGGARSPLWCRMIADVTQLRVETLADPEMAAAGAARLARVASGYPEAPAAAVSAVFEPDRSGTMPAKAERFRQLHDIVLDVRRVSGQDSG